MHCRGFLGGPCGLGKRSRRECDYTAVMGGKGEGREEEGEGGGGMEGVRG